MFPSSFMLPYIYPHPGTGILTGFPFDRWEQNNICFHYFNFFFFHFFPLIFFTRKKRRRRKNKKKKEEK